MSLVVGELVGYMKLDKSGWDRDLRAGESDLRGATSRFGGLIKGLGVAAAGAGVAAAGGLAVLAKNAVDSASDVGESWNKVDVVFGKSAAGIRNWAKTSATDLGLSKAAAYTAAGTFGNLFTQLEIGTEPAARMSKQMIGLAADFGSFHNADITEVIEAQTAAFRGEYDSLQRFVPTINAAAVEQRALAMTGKETTKELTAQEKALATQKLMMEGAGKATGDFGRTSGSMANVTRTLGAQFQDLSAKVGKQLLPYFEQFSVWVRDHMPEIQRFIVNAVKTSVRWIRDDFIPAVKALGDWWSRNGETIVGVVKFIGERVGEVFRGFAALVRPGVAAITWVVENFQNMRDDVHVVFLRMLGITAAWADTTLRLAEKAVGWLPQFKGKFAEARETVSAARAHINSEITRITASKAVRIAVDKSKFDAGMFAVREKLVDTISKQWNVPVGVIRANVGDGLGAPPVVGGGSAVATVKAAMASIPGLSISSTYRPGAITASGRPSYHGDANNPAVDVVAASPGPLDALYSVLNDVPHRELLWRVPNHAPGDNMHLHFAEKGLLARGPMVAMVGESAQALRGGGEVISPVGMMADTFRSVLREEQVAGSPIVVQALGEMDVWMRAQVRAAVREARDAEPFAARPGR